jgi:hypothetical protein
MARRYAIGHIYVRSHHQIKPSLPVCQNPMSGKKARGTAGKRVAGTPYACRAQKHLVNGQNCLSDTEET